MTETYLYPGNELELFVNARNWKKYFSAILKEYCKGSILEVGAGIGSNTLFLCENKNTKWTLLEPDSKMFNILKNKIASAELPYICTAQKGTIDLFNESEKFDTILYIDVLEHIENDKAEIAKASKLLNTGGHLIVLSPAFQFLFSPFDEAIGHYRRYTKKSLKKITPAELKEKKLFYLDSMGYFSSLMNKIFLNQKYPTKNQVRFWDKKTIPVSKITDKIFFHLFGKSVIGIWEKTNKYNNLHVIGLAK